jgi:hypothetical protein
MSFFTLRAKIFRLGFLCTGKNIVRMLPERFPKASSLISPYREAISLKTPQDLLKIPQDPFA